MLKVFILYLVFSYVDSGIATHYGCGWNGRRGASGIEIDCKAPICAHRSLPFGTIVKVTNDDIKSKNYKQSDLCIVFDRGPHGNGRILDMMPYQLWGLAGKRVGGLRVKISIYSSKYSCVGYGCLYKKLKTRKINDKWLLDVVVN